MPVEPEFGPRFELAAYAGRSLRGSFDSVVANFLVVVFAADAAPRLEFLEPVLELTRDAVREDVDDGLAGDLLVFALRGRCFPDDEETTWLLELTSKVADDSIVV